MLTPPTPPILQFGTSRFLLAHAALFVSQALDAQQALGGILVVQTTRSEASARRVAALAGGAAYPVRVRGLRGGAVVDETLACHAVHDALQADTSWSRLLDAVAGDVRVIVSNTGDEGFALDDGDRSDCLGRRDRVPRSFPAKLLVLLHGRWRAHNPMRLSIFPCELVERNGDTLRDLVAGLAMRWNLGGEFSSWLREHCVWANSLVDRIVSEPLNPVGAVAEPYALWAIERQPGLVLPCRHPAIVLTDDLSRHERLKLLLLNLGHTFLAERWLVDGRDGDETVLQAMHDDPLRTELEAVWAQEVLPVFDALGQGADAARYLVDLRERLCNPFLAHRLADIAQNHARKKMRRLAPVVALASQLGLALPQRRLRQALGPDEST
jgi:tagaturonate reductase